MTALRLYDTAARRKRDFVPQDPGRVTMYVCGPTVYGPAHVGNFRPEVVFDVLFRLLRHLYGEDAVLFSRNFTDVDDKINAKAAEEGVDISAITQRYTKIYHEDAAALNVLPKTFEPTATGAMPEIIAFIERLVGGGHAYAEQGHVLFSVTAYQAYGDFSRRSLDDMLAGTRFDVDPRKESPADFALWKAARPGEPAWESPWGPGRPGWHIECSAMAAEHLGPQIDIHGGGADLIFPHHENEIAQSESLHDHLFARCWVHNGMLQLLNPQTRQLEKMSKSLGNVVTIKQFLARYDADVLRLLVLSSSYRSPLTYNDEIAADHQRKLDRLRSALEPAVGSLSDGPAVSTLDQARSRLRERFMSAMDSDLNSAAALAVLFEFVRGVNAARDAGVGSDALSRAQQELRELCAVLGLRLHSTAAAADTEAGPLLDLLVEMRTELRRLKQWALSDTIRDRLAALGITLEDGAGGTRWRRSS